MKPLWDQTNEHSRQLSELNVRQAVHQEMLSTHSAQINQIAKDASERHGEVRTMIELQTDKLDDIIRDQNQEKGAALYKRWLIPVLVGLLAIAVSMGYVK